MRCDSFQQFEIVTGDTAQLLTAQLNAKLYELRRKHPTVTFEGLTARISYQETVYVSENLVDEYEEQGVRLTCQDCPFFEPVRKKDGTEDRRARWGDCPHAKSYGRTFKDSAACETLFNKLNSGEVRLCLAETE